MPHLTASHELSPLVLLIVVARLRLSRSHSHSALSFLLRSVINFLSTSCRNFHELDGRMLPWISMGMCRIWQRQDTELSLKVGNGNSCRASIVGSKKGGCVADTHCEGFSQFICGINRQSSGKRKAVGKSSTHILHINCMLLLAGWV